MKTNKERKQAISLIVLIITIIVMIILAGTVVISLNNNGIFERAQEAVDKTNEAQIKQIAQLGWAEAYANGARTVEALQAGVEDILEKNKIDTSAYGIKVTTSGVEVVRGWIQDGLNVKRGDDVLVIGSDFEYDPKVEGYTAGWKVLGAEDGELLIMSTEDIGYLELGDVDSDNLTLAQNDWLTGAEQLDELCEPYGKGKDATGARSIRVEDVDKITGFDKTMYGKGQLDEYGNIVTYSYNGTEKPAYVGSNGKSGTLNQPYQIHTYGFHFYNGIEFVHVNDLTTGTEGTTFATLKSDGYNYYAPELETIDKTSKAYTMLFGEYENEDTYYWLASPYVFTGTACADFGMLSVEDGQMISDTLWWSLGYTDCYESGVRAVVSLAADIQVTGDSTNGWSY